MKSNYFLHHKQALKSLKKILKLDPSLIFTSIFEAVLTGIYPYLSLYLVNVVIDSLLNKTLNTMPQNVILWLIAAFGTGILIDFLESLNEVKLKDIHCKFLRMIGEKSMTTDYEEMEKGELLQKLSDARYVVEHLGGYDVFLKYYIALLGQLMILGSSFVMIVQMCFSLPAKEQNGILGFISRPFLSLLLITALFVLHGFVSARISKKSKMRTAEGYTMKMGVERGLDYYVDRVFGNVEFGKDIRLFQMADYILSSYMKTLKKSIAFYHQYYDDVAKNKESFHKILMFAVQWVAYVVILLKVYSKAISVGTLSGYVGAIHLFNQSVGELLDINQKISLQADFIRVFDEFLESENKKAHGNKKISLEERGNHVIEFHNVSYRYENAEQDTLKNVSCRLDFRSAVGIVGRNGAGKTTFIKLLAGLYEPTGGYITLNGTDIKEYDYNEYLSLFSVVFQDFQLFAFPIDVNISVNSKPDKEKVKAAMEEVGMTERVEKLSNKENTPLFKLEESGVNFSGGELQKFAIARAVYKNSPMVILDEPTAALDPESEYEIFQKMSRFIRQKAGVFISHRMGSCRFCDEILVLEQGEILQRGTHEELLRDRSGLYCKLYSAQAKHYGTNSLHFEETP